MRVRQTTTCHTCRARKLGCDGKIPACSQCLHSGRLCSGYQHDLIFVKQKSKPRKRLQRSTKQSKELLITGGISPSVPTKGLPLKECSSLIIGRYAPWLMGLTGHANLAKSPFHICGSWVGVIPKLLERGGFGEALSSAVYTLALSIKSTESIYVPPSISFTKTHCLALNSLRKSLVFRDGQFGEELVAACMCLTMAEFLLPTWNIGYMIHLKGVEKLLQLAGPEQYSTGPSYQLFMGIRPLLIFGCFESRRPSFLEDEQWQTVPFQVYPASPMQSLLNHAARVPSLMMRFDVIIKHQTESNLPVACEILNSFCIVLKLLHDWEQSYRPRIQDPPYWLTESRNLSHSLVGDISKYSLWFPNLFVANVFTHLWALQIICIMHCQQLRVKFPEIPINGVGVEHDPWIQLVNESVYEVARRICRSMEYLLQDEARYYAEASTLFPLRVAYLVFKQDKIANKENLTWCEGIVNQLVFQGVNLSSLL